MRLNEDRGASYRETTKLSTTSQKQCMYPTIHYAKLNDWQRVNRCTCNYQICDNCLYQTINNGKNFNNCCSSELSIARRKRQR